MDAHASTYAMCLGNSNTHARTPLLSVSLCLGRLQEDSWIYCSHTVSSGWYVILGTTEKCAYKPKLCGKRNKFEITKNPEISKIEQIRQKLYDIQLGTVKLSR